MLVAGSIGVIIDDQLRSLAVSAILRSLSERRSRVTDGWKSRRQEIPSARGWRVGGPNQMIKSTTTKQRPA